MGREMMCSLGLEGKGETEVSGEEEGIEEEEEKKWSKSMRERRENYGKEKLVKRP